MNDGGGLHTEELFRDTDISDTANHSALACLMLAAPISTLATRPSEGNAHCGHAVDNPALFAMLACGRWVCSNH